MGQAASFEINPERFGRYVLLDRIGVGGMAEIFRAVMPGVEGFQRTFVVKRILPERAQSTYFVDMFVQEARINALLHHPNIVQVFDFGTVGGTYFLAMEYVRGRDVSSILRRLRDRERACPPGVAAFITHEVALALGYAHALTGPDVAPLNIIHRDVSPSNILCQRAGGVKLLDFGIAKAFGEPEVEKTGQRLFKGKLSYVAPERIKDLPLDGRSDLFSLGVVLWEMLAGRRLFRGPTDLETLKNVLEMEIPAPSTLRDDVPASLDRIVVRALAREPADRYQTGTEMADELEGALEELRYQPRALPDLLHELFGAELSSRQIPVGRLTAELLAAAAAEPATASLPTPVSSSGPPAIEPPEVSISFGTGSIPAAPPRVRRRWLWWVAASAGTAALGALLLVRGGGGRSHGATLPLHPVPTVAASPAPKPTPAPSPAAAPPTSATTPAAPQPPETADAPAEPNTSAAAKPARRAWTGKGRIARGLSVDPFAEAASRGKR